MKQDWENHSSLAPEQWADDDDLNDLDAHAEMHEEAKRTDHLDFDTYYLTRSLSQGDGTRTQHFLQPC